jgi:hypothetical protein
MTNSKIATSQPLALILDLSKNPYYEDRLLLVIRMLSCRFGILLVRKDLEE